MPKRKLTEEDKEAAYARLWGGFMKFLTPEKTKDIKSEADLQRHLTSWLGQQKADGVQQGILERQGKDLISSNIAEAEKDKEPPEQPKRKTKIKIRTIRNNIRKYSILTSNLEKKYKVVGTSKGEKVYERIKTKA